MNKYWFKPKTYGWGFVPISWEGWLATLGMVGILMMAAYSHGFFESEISTQDGVGFLVDLVIIGIVGSILMIPKTKGKVRWQWGK